ncbi:MAG: hypothetical protein ACK4K1_02515 [Flavobacterium sp.]
MAKAFFNTREIVKTEILRLRDVVKLSIVNTGSNPLSVNNNNTISIIPAASSGTPIGSYLLECQGHCFDVELRLDFAPGTGSKAILETFILKDDAKN